MTNVPVIKKYSFDQLTGFYIIVVLIVNRLTKDHSNILRFKIYYVNFDNVCFYFVNSRSLSFFFQLVFESIRGANFTSDMAIDDITIDAGTCQEGKVINIIFRKMRDEDACFFCKITIYRNHTHTSQKWSFALRISSLNVTKSAVSCGFGHIYWRNS